MIRSTSKPRLHRRLGLNGNTRCRLRSPTRDQASELKRVDKSCAKVCFRRSENSDHVDPFQVITIPLRRAIHDPSVSRFHRRMGAVRYISSSLELPPWTPDCRQPAVDGVQRKGTLRLQPYHHSVPASRAGAKFRNAGLSSSSFTSYLPGRSIDIPTQEKSYRPSSTSSTTFHNSSLGYHKAVLVS